MAAGFCMRWLRCGSAARGRPRSPPRSDRPRVRPRLPRPVRQSAAGVHRDIRLHRRGGRSADERCPQGAEGVSVGEAMETRFTPIRSTPSSARRSMRCCDRSARISGCRRVRKPVGLITREDILAGCASMGAMSRRARHALGRRQRPPGDADRKRVRTAAGPEARPRSTSRTLTAESSAS